MPVLRIKWVNNNEPFNVGRHMVTATDWKRATLAKIGALKDVLTGLDGLDDATRTEIREEARNIAAAAQANTLIHGILSRVDASVKELSPDEVGERLSMDEYQSLAEAFQGGPGGEGAESPLGPRTKTA